MNAELFRCRKFLLQGIGALGIWLLSGLAVPGFAASEKVVVAVPHRVLFTVAVPVYVAEEKGFFKEAGVEIDSTFTKGGGETTQAVVSGDVDIGLGTGMFAVLSAFAKKAPVKIIAAEITGMDAFWYALGTSSVRGLKDVAGKRVGFSRPGASSHMAVLALADQVKAMGLDRPEPVSLGGLPDTLTAVKTGQADLGWSVAPFLLDRVEKGELRIVVRGSDIAALRQLTMRVHFANANFVSRRPAALRGFLRGHQRALDYMFEHPKETAEIWMKRADLKMPEATVLKTWDFYTREILRAKPVRNIEKTMESAIDFKFLKKPLTKAELGKLIDLSYLP